MKMEARYGTWKAMRTSGEYNKICWNFGDEKNNRKGKYGTGTCRCEKKKQIQRGEVFEKYKHNLVEVKKQSNSDFIWANEHYHMTRGMIWFKRCRSEQNGQDNKCPRSSQTKIIIHFAVAAHDYTNVVGERFLADDSKIYDRSLRIGVWEPANVQRCDS